jgi:hypothetical protein
LAEEHVTDARDEYVRSRQNEGRRDGQAYRKRHDQPNSQLRRGEHGKVPDEEYQKPRWLKERGARHLSEGTITLGRIAALAPWRAGNPGL